MAVILYNTVPVPVARGDFLQALQYILEPGTAPNPT